MMPYMELVAYESAKGRVVVRMLKSIFGLRLDGIRILEIGCSTGALMKLLGDGGCDVYGVDVESSWSCHYCYKPEKRILLDIQEKDLPVEWEKEGFDLVIAQEVIEHIKRPYDFLQRVQRVLKPNGCLLLTTPNLNGVAALLKGRRWCGVATEGHAILYSPRSLDFTVCNCGFRRVKFITNIIPIVYQDNKSWLWRINRAFMGVRIGSGLVGLYKKS
jgi:2-polyprenyl-3-methyl-5-hydroxy-6-metoxy-1,4-benzoquinol methylase